MQEFERVDGDVVTLHAESGAFEDLDTRRAFRHVESERSPSPQSSGPHRVVSRDLQLGHFASRRNVSTRQIRIQNTKTQGRSLEGSGLGSVDLGISGHLNRRFRSTEAFAIKSRPIEAARSSNRTREAL